MLVSKQTTPRPVPRQSSLHLHYLWKTVIITQILGLYAQKLQLTITSFAKYGMGFIDAKNTKSGINIILDVKSEKSAEMLCQEAESLRLYVATLNQNSETEQKNRQLIFYYNQIPIDLLEDSIKSLTKLWAS